MDKQEKQLDGRSDGSIGGQIDQSMDKQINQGRYSL